MGRPILPAPDFDDQRPWGAYPPSAGVAARLALAHAMPPALGGLTTLLRRPVKYRATTPLDLDIWGLKLRLLPRGNHTDQEIYTAPQLFDREELALLRDRLRPGGVFVDVGANAGIYSFWAHLCMQGQGRILAVEPDPEMRRRLAFNAQSNGLGTIDLCPLALSDHEGEAELRINLRQRGQNTLEAAEASRTGDPHQVLKVPLTTLVALLASKDIDHVDVLKIDIEGHEPPVLRHFLTHAPESLWPGAVISEFKADTAADILGLLAERGYRRRKTTRRNFILERG
jgi:FkbM family methyltransferase